MAASSSNPDVFDVRKIRRLIELMNEHDLTEMNLRQGDMRIQLRRGGDAGVSAAVALPSPVAAAPSPAPAAASEASAKAGGTGGDSAAIVEITSPMVGTFYSSPDPDSAPYVKVGDHVGQDTTVCIVEAMKVFNEIQAEVSGTIAAVLVESGEPVEFGQPLFKVDTGQ